MSDLTREPTDANSNIESLLLLTTTTPNEDETIPKDTFNMAYIIYFTLGFAFLLPWNSFITAVDYFSYLYPSANVDRVFAFSYMTVRLISLVLIIFSSHKSSSFVRINIGLGIFIVALLVVPAMDAFYIKGRVGLYDGFHITVGLTTLSGVAVALVESGIIGAASEMPERYMQAVVSGSAASGVLISFLRLLTKAVFPQDASGLRKSANLYFLVGIVVMAICTVLYNESHKLPIIKYYKELKNEAINEEQQLKGPLTGSSHRAALLEIFKMIKGYAIGIIFIFTITSSIFPGYITEDVHSKLLKDWYPVILLTIYNVFDLIGKSLTALYLIKNGKIAIGGSVARFLFLPLFYGCLHGPMFFRGEIPVIVLTCLLALTNGYITSVLLILAPKTVPLQHAETTGIALVLIIGVGLVLGSVVTWFWVI